MRAPTVALLCLLVTVPAMSQTTMTVKVEGIPIQVGEMADTEDAIRWKILAKHKQIDSKEVLRKTAREALLKSKALPHEFQRVEIAGMLAVDEINEAHSEMFNIRLKLSNLNEARESRGSIRDALNSVFNKGKDLTEALSDTRGNPTDRSKTIIAQLKDKRINELFAHSWGTEAVYLGLLSGEILPPKKLVVVGVPEANEAKWLILAKYMGIEVHVVGFAWDKAKVAGNLASRFKSGLPKDEAGLESLWSSRCAKRDWKGCADPAKFLRTKFDYNVGVRPPDAPKDEFFKMHLSKLDHDRMLYYRYLYNRNLFNKTIVQLDAPQVKLIRAEEDRILAEAMVESRRLIALARAQAKIAQRDHDERLKRTYADIAVRSCAIPGSVTQAELNALAEPYDQKFVDSAPQGLDDCATWVYLNLRRGVDAEQIRKVSARTTPGTAQPVPPPFNPQPVADPKPVQTIPGIRFSSQFPFLKDLAVKACNSPAQVSLQPNQIRSAYMYSFERESDDRLAAEMSATMGNCPRQVFNKLIERIRSGNGEAVDAKWLRDTAALYIPRGGGDYVAPPLQGCIPGDNSRRNCIACGNKYCP